MPEWGHLLFWPVYLYLVASCASLLVHGTRGSNQRASTAAEAGLRVVFPTVSLLFIPAAALLGLEPACRNWAVHEFWHRWENLLHSSTNAHTFLHLGSLLLLAAILACIIRTVAW